MAISFFERRIIELEKLLLKKTHIPGGYTNPDYYGFWTKQELACKLSENLNLTTVISPQTIGKDIKKMIENYNAPIKKKYITFMNYDIDKYTYRLAYYYNNSDFRINID